MKDLYVQITTLTEREKELKCLYNIDKCLSGNDLYQILRNIAGVIPAGWQFPSACSVEINCYDLRIRSPRFEISGNSLSADIISDDNTFGHITVYYPNEIDNNRPEFLPEEQVLLNSIARRISMFLSLPAAAPEHQEKTAETHWEWRYRMAVELCNFADFSSLKIKAIYIAGSTKNATAGPASDIDLIIIHTSDNTTAITEYFKGWSHCLSVWNEFRTGISQKDGILDLHLLHESELGSDDSWATMLRSTENSAKLIRSAL